MITKYDSVNGLLPILTSAIRIPATAANMIILDNKKTPRGHQGRQLPWLPASPSTARLLDLVASSLEFGPYAISNSASLRYIPVLETSSVIAPHICVLLKKFRHLVLPKERSRSTILAKLDMYLASQKSHRWLKIRLR